MTRIADYVDSAGLRAGAGYHRLAPLARTGAQQAAVGARQAAAVVAPYASTARIRAAYYAGYWMGGARQRMALIMAQAKGALPPNVEHAVETAAKHTRTTVKNAAEYTAPRVSHAMATARTAAEPVADEAMTRGTAALAALRGKVTPREIEKLARRRARRERGERVAMRVAVAGMVASGSFAAWKWWSQQSSPDWLVEEPEEGEAGTGAAGRTTFDSVDGTGPVTPDQDLQARQAEEGRRGNGETPQS